MTLRLAKILLLIAFITNLNAQDKIVIVGDSFVGKKVGLYSFREFIGNVVMTHGKVKVTCERAVQNLTLDQVQLIGNVVITQDSIQIFTDTGFYYGKEEKAFSHSGIRMVDGSSELTADSGYYFVNEEIAHFYGNVVLTDSSKKMTANKLYYFNSNDSSLAIGNVIVIDSNAVIYTDSLIYLNETDYSHAFGNTKIVSEKDRLTIYSDEFFNYGDSNYTLLKGRPLMIKVDSTSTGYDTLYLSSEIMESYYDTVSVLIAKDSVLLKRGNFSSVSDLTMYYRDENKIFTYKINDEANQPVLWYENSQLAGDSVFIYLKDNSLDSISVVKNAVLISQNENFDFRFDQISGYNVVLKFKDGNIERTKVNGNVLSIYYLYEENEPNGLIKSSAKYAEIIFEDNEVVKVNMAGTPVSEYHPEKLVAGKEKEFTLPTFKIYKNRPTIKQVIGTRKIF